MSENSTQGSLTNALGRGMLKLIRFYTFNSPIRRGKLRLSRFGMKFARSMPGDVLVTTVDGRRLFADLSTGMCESLFFRGEYERAVSSVVESVVRRGDICLDVGANLGWYTTLLQRLTGPRGAVHAFEPVPRIYAALEKNVALMDDSSNVFINNFALGDAPGKVELHLFAGLPNGHSSISTMGRTDFTTVESRIETLDSYLEGRHVGDVDFVKVDVEGAELMFLKGAEKLFEQTSPPIWMIEMALGTTKGFDYLPNDLVTYLRKRADYDFYAVGEPTLTLKLIDGFAPEDIGANVLCLPSARYGTRFEQARLSLSKITKSE